MKIMLILAASKNDPLKKNDPFMPLSLPLIAASSPEHSYQFIDMLAGEKINYKTDAVLIGISSRITAEKTAFAIADQFKKLGKTVILGGAQISSNPFQAKIHCNSVVIGEGEFLWPQLIKDLTNNKLKDFYVCSKENFDFTGYSVFKINDFPDLTNIKLPLRNIYKKKYVFDTVFASRGCPINCEFCSVSTLFGKKIRLRKIDDVVYEISQFKGYYYILDDTVFGRPSVYDYYLELYKKISKLKKFHLWTGQANLDAASTQKGRDVIRQAEKAGFLYAAIGIESINPEVLKKSGIIKKMGVKNEADVIEKIKENIRFIQEQGIIISGWFTVGFDEDTIQTYYDILDFCDEMNIIPIISPLEVLPGTRLYERLSKENRINSTKKINLVHPNINDEEAMKTLKIINKKAFSFSNILKRTIFYSLKFDKNNNNFNKKVFNKIHKTIFAFVLQWKLKKGVVGLANSE